MRIKGSVVLAAVIALAAIGWIASGQMQDRPATASPPDRSGAEATVIAPAPTRVRVRDLIASPHVASVLTSGQTEAARMVTVRAETYGRILDTPTPKGSAVDRGALIVALDPADRPARLREAKARIAQRQIEHNAASKLAQKGFQAETKLAEAMAELAAAKAEREVIEVDLARARITAPLAGVIDDRVVEVGDYVQAGDPVATLVELDPLLVTAQISERQAPRLEVGMTANARLSNGDALIGVVRYVSSVADETTRTFRIEIEIANPDNRLGQGLTAEIEIALPAEFAHRVAPSIFKLNAQGQLGVMTVDAANTARFTPVSVIGVDDAGTWVSGLPEQVRIITVGQDLVDDGETIVPVVVAADGAAS
jgi:multidrug efflux system membrane fusion protein